MVSHEVPERVERTEKVTSKKAEETKSASKAEEVVVAEEVPQSKLPPRPKPEAPPSRKEMEAKVSNPQPMLRPKKVVNEEDRKSTDFVTGIKPDEEKLGAIREELRFAWQKYKEHAWGQDILQPLSKRGRRWMGYGCTIIDALDTLFIAGLDKEYKEGIDWVENKLDFQQFEPALPLFESVIRILGGLLGAYTLDPRPRVLEQALNIGEKLFYAVSASKSHFPHPTSRWQSKSGSGPQIVLAEVGTLQMEYVALAGFTGKMKFADGVLKAFKYFHKTGKGLFGENCNVQGGTCNGKLSVGGGSDSTYEYFAKMYLMSGLKVEAFHELWERTVRDLKPMLSKSTPSELVYFGEMRGAGQAVQPTWGHLNCFVGGTYAVMAKHAADEKKQKEEFEIGAGIARTCHAMYAQSPTGVGSSGIRFAPGNDFSITSRDYVLRPEAIESWFYMYRHTKDEKYREWAWNAFLSIKANCRTAEGYAGLRDVTRPKSYEDSQETFFLAETLKYLYCIFADETVCDLRKYVFNTEAHPLPIFDPETNPKYSQLYNAMK